MAIFGIHFYYRHLALCGSKNSLETFKGSKLILWLLIPPTFALIWALTAGITFAPTAETDAEIANSIIDSYDLRLADIVYIAAFIWPTDPAASGMKYLNLRPALGIVIEEMIVISSLSAIFYFGRSCYKKIRRHVRMAGTVSKVTKSLHRQLFYALVMQTAIPIVLLHAPVSGLFVFPVLDTDLGFFTGFVTITIAVYPAIDPLPTMFIIENYRHTIFNFFAFLCRPKLTRTQRNSGAQQPSVSTTINS
ncbi:unnamed protein product [Caenorhabditis sp. 36 PRJEB53466]|nr:unnamed protein product [Caenorhabditis sp. 36 PRJEB53466]